jgi:predicted GIY-YIG superfamily endonuclease
MKNQGTIYLLHFSEPYKHARHYTGFTKELSARLAEHASGTGARLLQVITEAGLSFELVRTWKGTRKSERQIKRHGGASRICPMCNPKALNRARAIN